MIQWLLFSSLWAFLFRITARTGSQPSLLIDVTNQELSPYWLLVVMVGSGLILFALIGAAIILFYASRHNDDPDLDTPEKSAPPPARPNSPPPDTPEKTHPGYIQLGLELNWQDMLSLKTEWKQGNLRREPERQVLFPPGNLCLRFRVEIPANISGTGSELDLSTVRLTADFNCNGIPSQQNLYRTVKNMKITASNDHLLSGELLLKEPLEEGMYTFFLEARDTNGILRRIDLRFSCIHPVMTLQVENDQTTAWVRRRSDKVKYSYTDLVVVPPEALRFSFWVKGLPEPIGSDAWLDSRHIPELIASFPLQPHPKITIRPGTNLLKGGEVLRSIVFTRWQKNQIQGTFFVNGPLPEGLHSLQFTVKDDPGNTYQAILEFVVSSGALLAVNQVGERLQMITPVKWEKGEVNEDSIRRCLFNLQAANPLPEIKAKGKLPSLSAQIESLDTEGKLLVPAFKVTMLEDASAYCLNSSVPLLAFPFDKPAPVSGNILPVPVVPGGALRASLEQEDILPLELPVAQLKIERAYGSFEENGKPDEQILDIYLWFTLPGVNLPAEVYLFLENGATNQGHWQASAQPIFLHGSAPQTGNAAPVSALAKFRYTGENCPLGAFSIFSEIPLNQSWLEAELALSLDPNDAQPTATIRIPLCSLSSLWMEVGDREFNPDEMRKDFAINPLVDGKTLPLSLSVRPVGSAVNALGCIRMEVERKPLAWQVVEHPSLQTVTGPDEIERFGRLDVEWKPELAQLCAGNGTLVFCYNVRAFDPAANSTFWYRLKRTVPSLPVVNEIERTSVEVGWRDEQNNKEEVHQIEGSLFLNPQHAVVLRPGSLVQVNCTLRAKNLYGDLVPVCQGVPVTWKMEESTGGGQILDGKKAVSQLRNLTDENGIASVWLRIPQAGTPGDVPFSLVIQPQGGEPASFPFRTRQRAIHSVEGPRQVIINSQHTYEMVPSAADGKENATEWAFYLPKKDGSMQEQPDQTGRGKTFTCAFNRIENQRGNANPPDAFSYWLVARLQGDEEIIPLCALEIDITPHIENDILELGDKLELHAAIKPVGTALAVSWQWLLQREDEEKPLLLEHTETAESQESSAEHVLDQPGNYRLRVEAGNGFREHVFRVEPLRIFGAHMLLPGETTRLTLRNENLVQAVWTVYRGVNKITSATGANMDWRAGAVGYYEVVVDWVKDEHPASSPNDAVHRILVARIYSDPPLGADVPVPPGEQRKFLTNPVEFRGRKPRWRITYQKGEKRWTEDLGEKMEGIWLKNTGEAEKGYLEASFGFYEDMGEVITRTIVLLNPEKNDPTDEKTVG